MIVAFLKKLAPLEGDFAEMQGLYEFCYGESTMVARSVEAVNRCLKVEKH